MKRFKQEKNSKKKSKVSVRMSPKKRTDIEQDPETEHRERHKSEKKGVTTCLKTFYGRSEGSERDQTEKKKCPTAKLQKRKSQGNLVREVQCGWE